MADTFRTHPMVYSAENREPQTSVWTLSNGARGLPLNLSQKLTSVDEDKEKGGLLYCSWDAKR